MTFKYLRVVLAVASVIAVTQSSQAEVLKPDAFIPRCGNEMLTDEGGIFYKPFETIWPYERCTWIIGVAGAVGYEITVEFLGPPTNEQGSGQELLLTGVRHAGNESPHLVEHRPTGVGSFTVEDSNIVIVAFYSSQVDSTSARGFAIQYKSLFEGDINATSPTSDHHLFEDGAFQFPYPQNGSYSGNELSAFLFPPTNGICSDNGKHVWYRRRGLNPSIPCDDALFIYNFNTSLISGKWEEVGRICEDTTDLHVSYDDMVMILFQSNGREAKQTELVVNEGFWFWFTSC